MKSVLESILSIGFVQVAFSRGNALAWEMTNLLALAFAAWLLFSTHKRAQVRKLISAFRGF